MGTIEDVVAELQFYDLPALRDALQQGVRLRPQRNPGNEADRNAVSLWLDCDEADRWELTPLIGGDPRRQRRAPHRRERPLEAESGGGRDAPWSAPGPSALPDRLRPRPEFHSLEAP